MSSHPLPNVVALLVFVFALSAAAGEPPADALIGELPFLVEPNASVNRIFVNLAPEGRRELRMMLDTGAAPNVLTPLYARSLGILVRRNKSSPYRRSTVLGRDLQFWIDTRSSDTGSKTGFEYGLLGGEVPACPRDDMPLPEFLKFVIEDLKAYYFLEFSKNSFLQNNKLAFVLRHAARSNASASESSIITRSLRALRFLAICFFSTSHHLCTKSLSVCTLSTKASKFSYCA